jgi:hypothetical protein
MTAHHAASITPPRSHQQRVDGGRPSPSLATRVPAAGKHVPGEEGRKLKRQNEPNSIDAPPRRRYDATAPREQPGWHDRTR